MTRTQWALVGLLAAQAVLLGLCARGADDTAPVASRPLFPDLGAADPARIEIVDGGDGTAGPLTIESHDGGWVLPAKGGFPADPAKVEQLLDRLKGIEVRRPVVTGARYHETLEVAEDKFVRRVRILDAAGEPLADLWLGRSPNYQVVDVRAEGDDRVYEARDLSTWDFNPDASAWIDANLTDVPLERIVEVRVQNRSGRFTLRREPTDDGSASWWLTTGGERREADRSEAERFVRRVATLRASEPAGPVDETSQGLAPPAARIEIEHGAAASGDTEVTTLLVGKRFATRSGLGFAVLVSKWDADAILDQDPTEF